MRYVTLLLMTLLLPIRTASAQEVPEPPELRSLQALGEEMIIIRSSQDGAYGQTRMNFENGAVFATAPMARSVVDMIASRRIQQHIELSPTQIKKLEELQKELHEGYKEIREKYPNEKTTKMDIAKRKEIIDAMRKETSELRERIENEFKANLVPLQLKQIKQIRFNQSVQYRGFSWTVSNQPFQADIETTKAQRDELAKIKQEAEAEIRKMTEKIRKEAKEKMLKSLEEKQRKVIEDLESDSEKPKNIRL